MEVHTPESKIGLRKPEKKLAVPLYISKISGVKYPEYHQLSGRLLEQTKKSFVRAQRKNQRKNEEVSYRNLKKADCLKGL